jgi:hypothetical protein
MRGSRRFVALAAIGAVAAAALSASSGAAAQPQPAPAADADVQLRYLCAFPSGELSLVVRVQATFPDSVVRPEPIRQTGVIVTVTLSPAAIAELTAIGAASVSAATDLTVTVNEPNGPVDIAWFGLVAPDSPIPDTGELPLPATGQDFEHFATSAGEFTFVAAALNVTLTPLQADGTPTDPPSLFLFCALEPDQNGLLATVTVDDPPIPDGCGDIEPIEPFLPTGCSYITGLTNVAKLGAAARIEPGLLNIALANFEFTPDGLLLQHNRGELLDGRFPPSDATFLAFGFMPIRATMELRQVGPMPVELVAQGRPPFLYFVGTSGAVELRITNVTVNGMPLDVGPNCRSAEPMAFNVGGGTPEYTDITLGGPLHGIVTIPPFSGCGVTEDLDPLLTGTVSGPGNYIRMQQGTLCTPADPFRCPPTVPEAGG